MSRCSVNLTWADGEYTFCLPLAQIEELQRICDAGPLVIAERLRQGFWKAEDIHATIRLGLIGGGMKPVEALRLVRLYVHEQPLADNAVPALAVINAALFGVEYDPVGKSPAAGETDQDPPAETD